MSSSSDARPPVACMTGEGFMRVWPLHMEQIAEQLNPTQPHRFPQPDLQLHAITFTVFAGAGGATV